MIGEFSAITVNALSGAPGTILGSASRVRSCGEKVQWFNGFNPVSRRLWKRNSFLMCGFAQAHALL